MQRRAFIRNTTLASLAAGTSPEASQETHTQPADVRLYWQKTLLKIADPVINALVQQQLKASMPVEAQPGKEAERRAVSHLEAVGRVYAGMAPWIELGEDASPEGKLRKQYADGMRQGLSSIVNPASPDYLTFTEKSSRQPLVDAATLAHALIRAPQQLIGRLDTTTRDNVVTALKATRAIKPPYNNWLLFTAMIEAALKKMEHSWDAVRIEYALRSVAQWYLGDGVYGDGPAFHWDYYNSLVIHPWLLDILEAVKEPGTWYAQLYEQQLKRAQRYAELLERMISPEGTYPPTGRSLAYRFGAFHLLSHLALKNQLPDSLPPGQVRSALTAVMQRTLQAPDTFDKDGWLTIGFYGHQPAIGEGYISTGSLYASALAFLPLGLPPGDLFWRSPAQDWTSRKVWAGENIPADKYLSE